MYTDSIPITVMGNYDHHSGYEKNDNYFHMLIENVGSHI